MRTTALVTMICAALTGRALAGENTKIESLKTWFKHLRQGLMESSVESYNQKHRGVTAVAAVRGAKQGSVNPNRPEWKTAGKSKKIEIKKEREELARAAEQIIMGNFEAGRAALDAFEKAHPKSKLLPDLATARANLRELEAIEAKARLSAPGVASEISQEATKAQIKPDAPKPEAAQSDLPKEQ